MCMRECYRDVNRYLTCKRTTDLHPVYKDVQYLSRQRKLYNLETHIVKYVLVISYEEIQVSLQKYCRNLWLEVYLKFLRILTLHTDFS